MNEGRRTQVVLLDGRRLDIVVQPRLATQELLGIVASHCQLKPPDLQYFGLAYIDCFEQYHWLQLDRERRVLDHEFPRKYTSPGSTLVVYHLVRFAVRHALLDHPSTVELFFLCAKAQLLKGKLLFTELSRVQHVFANLLKFLTGDDTDNEAALSTLRRLSHSASEQGFLRPLHIAHNENFESEVLAIYNRLHDCSLGEVMIAFLTHCEHSATYGMNLYQVQEKSGCKVFLGINANGIMVFDPDNMQSKKQFRWKQLENLYYRDKKFSLEVRGAKRVEQSLSALNTYEAAAHNQPDELQQAVADPTTLVSVSRRTFVSWPVQVFAFVCATPQLCKAIWSFAVAQHTFYLDSGIHRMLDSSRSPQPQQQSVSSSSMAERLTRSLESGSSLQNFEGVSNRKEHSLSRVTVATTDSGISVTTHCLSSNTSQKSLTDRQKDLETYRELKARRKQVNDALVDKLAALKAICIEEGNITGKLAVEVHQTLAPGEPLPKVQRRVGTTFAIPADLFKTKSSKMDQIAHLEQELEVQRRIVSAAHKLANDKSTNKSVRKKRQRDYEAAAKRLSATEQRLQYLRHRGSQPDLVSHSLSCVSPQMQRPPSGGARLRASSLKASFNQLMGTGSSSSRSAAGNKAYPDFQGHPAVVHQQRHINVVPQSAPVTPHGSTPDLAATTDSETDSMYSIQHTAQHHAQPDDTTLLTALQHLRLQKPGTASDNGIGPVRLSPSANSSPQLPACDTNIGYRPPSRGHYQSSYRQRQYPTLPKSPVSARATYKYSAPAAAAPDVFHLSHQHRTHSQSSLQSLPASAYEGGVQPLPDYRTAGGSSIEHASGAYNLPRQRTSWLYNSVEHGLHSPSSQQAAEALRDRAASPARTVTSSNSGSVAFDLEPSTSTPKSSQAVCPVGYSGSLDRRLIKARQLMRQQHSPSSTSPNGNINNNNSPRSPASPVRAGGSKVAPAGNNCSSSGSLAVNVHCDGIEMMKPFETADAIKYARSNMRSPPQNGRPPPPPYRGSPTHAASFNRPHLNNSPLSSTAGKHSPVKKATVV